MLVRDRMKPNPITARPETTHKQAVEIMREHNIHHLPVLDNHDRLVGIVVTEDLRLSQPSPATTLSIYEIHSLLSRMPLRDVMHSPVQAVSPECPLEEAAHLMLDQRIGCLPVMENDRLIGIITDTDIFQTFVGMLGGGKEGARFTLRLKNQPGILAKVAQAVADAGGDIISVTTWHAEGEEEARLTIKEIGANFRELKAALDAINVEVLDLREHLICEQQRYN